MICPRCGKELSDTAKFCSGCGTKVEAETVQSAASDTPVGNVLTGTLPEQGTATVTFPEQGTATATFPEQEDATVILPEQGTATATLPETEDALRGETVKPEKKKFSPKRLIAAGVAVVCVAIACVVAAGCTFAKADFSHAFMGDEKYATAVLGQQLEQAASATALAGVTSAASGDTSSAAALSSSLASMKSVLPESGAEIEISVSADLSGELLEDFAYEIGCSTDKAKEILEAVKELKLKAGVRFGETDISAFASGIEQDNELIKVNAMYDADSEAYYISIPSVSDECLMFADDDAVIDMDALSRETDGKAAEKMLESVLRAYKDNLDDAEIEYGKTTFSIGDVEFNGKVSSVVFKDEALADMLSDVFDEFFDSDYADDLGDLSDMQNAADSLISELEYYDSVKLTIENYVNSNNSVAGMRIEVEVKDGGSKEKAEAAYLNTNDGFACSFVTDGTKVFELSQDKESKTSGKFSGKINSYGSTGKFTIDYENYREKKMFGRNIALGDYTLKLSGDLFESEDMPFDKITLKLDDEGDKLNYTVGVKAEGSTFSVKMAISEGFSETMDSMKNSDAYDLNSEADESEISSYCAALLDYIAAKADSSEFCTAVPYGDGTLADYLEETAARAIREQELTKNYGDYSSNTVYEANNAANRIYNQVRYLSFNSGSDETKIKLYYGKDGRLSILDNGGMSALENDILESLGGLEYKSAYVEITVWQGRGPVCGVSVVMTDDSSNIPENLPDAYNFLDKQYKWGTDDDVNFIGSFAVGAYPKLANGEGGAAKAADEKLAAAVNTSNKDAEKAAKAISQYTGLTFTEGKTSYLCFSVTNGTWKYYTYGGGKISGSSVDAAAYLSENVGTVSGKYVCFYYDGAELAGATVSDSSGYNSYAVDDFKRGSTEIWGYMDGIVGGNVVGTYPALTKLTALPQEYIDQMVGTWAHGDTTFTLTADDLGNAAFSFYRSYAGISNVYVTTAYKGSFYLYPNNGEPYISDGWYKYTKQ